MNMEEAYAIPLTPKKEEDSLAETPITERDLAKDKQRIMRNSLELLSQARELVISLERVNKMPESSDKNYEIDSIRRGMQLTVDLAKNQMELAVSDEEKEEIRTTINLIENNMSFQG